MNCAFMLQCSISAIDTSKFSCMLGVTGGSINILCIRKFVHFPLYVIILLTDRPSFIIAHVTTNEIKILLKSRTIFFKSLFTFESFFSQIQSPGEFLIIRQEEWIVLSLSYVYSLRLISTVNLSFSISKFLFCSVIEQTMCGILSA